MCSMKTILKFALGIVLLLILGHFAFPQYQAGIVAVAPFLLVLACPLAMYFMMGRRNPNEDKKTLDTVPNRPLP